MRKLKTTDLFAFARCIRNIGIKDEIQKIAMEANEVKDIASRGFEYFYILFEKAVDKNSEEHIYEFLSGPFEMTPEQIANMDPLEWMEHISKLADFKTWKTFFITAVR
jgi:hypothetical protein